jgi:hypothetical protein
MKEKFINNKLGLKNETLLACRILFGNLCCKISKLLRLDICLTRNYAKQEIRLIIFSTLKTKVEFLGA